MPIARRHLAVSPGFTPRPSLSGPRGQAMHPCASRVAGVHTSTFVERSGRAPAPPVGSSVAGVHTSAFVERSSRAGWSVQRFHVSPGFTPRPSLSETRQYLSCHGGGSVAGVHTSAFVERTWTTTPARSGSSVAGVHTSAFVERSTARSCSPAATSVAGVHTSAFVERRPWTSCMNRPWACRRGSHLGLR